MIVFSVRVVVLCNDKTDVALGAYVVEMFPHSFHTAVDVPLGVWS